MQRTTVVFSARQIGLIKHCCMLLQELDGFGDVDYHIHYTGKETEESDVEQTAKQIRMPVNQSRVDLDQVFADVKKRVEGKTLVCACAANTFLEQVKQTGYKYPFQMRIEEI